jgi:hypothetical protein
MSIPTLDYYDGRPDPEPAMGDFFDYVDVRNRLYDDSQRISLASILANLFVLIMVLIGTPLIFFLLFGR